MRLSLKEKTRRMIERLVSEGVPILDELPTGWRFMGVYCGPYQWANNGKSRFGDGYEHALVRTEGNDGSVPC